MSVSVSLCKLRGLKFGGQEVLRSEIADPMGTRDLEVGENRGHLEDAKANTTVANDNSSFAFNTNIS